MVKILYKHINNLLREILPFAVITSIVVGIIIVIIFGFFALKPFVLGVALSFFNFILLTISMHLLMNFNSSKAKNLFTLFFILRYSIIFLAVYTYASKNLFNIIFVIMGITMVLFSIKINAFVKHYTWRKESKNGGSKSCI